MKKEASPRKKYHFLNKAFFWSLNVDAPRMEEQQANLVEPRFLPVKNH